MNKYYNKYSKNKKLPKHYFGAIVDTIDTAINTGSQFSDALRGDAYDIDPLTGKTKNIQKGAAADAVEHSLNPVMSTMGSVGGLAAGDRSAGNIMGAFGLGSVASIADAMGADLFGKKKKAKELEKKVEEQMKYKEHANLARGMSAQEQYRNTDAGSTMTGIRKNGGIINRLKRGGRVPRYMMGGGFDMSSIMGMMGGQGGGKTSMGGYMKGAGKIAYGAISAFGQGKDNADHWKVDPVAIAYRGTKGGTSNTGKVSSTWSTFNNNSLSGIANAVRSGTDRIGSMLDSKGKQKEGDDVTKPNPTQFKAGSPTNAGVTLNDKGAAVPANAQPLNISSSAVPANQFYNPYGMSMAGGIGNFPNGMKRGGRILKHGGSIRKHEDGDYISDEEMYDIMNTFKDSRNHQGRYGSISEQIAGLKDGSGNYKGYDEFEYRYDDEKGKYHRKKINNYRHYEDIIQDYVDNASDSEIEEMRKRYGFDYKRRPGVKPPVESKYDKNGVPLATSDTKYRSVPTGRKDEYELVSRTPTPAATTSTQASPVAEQSTSEEYNYPDRGTYNQIMSQLAKKKGEVKSTKPGFWSKASNFLGGAADGLSKWAELSPALRKMRANPESFSADIPDYIAGKFTHSPHNALNMSAESSASANAAFDRTSSSAGARAAYYQVNANHRSNRDSEIWDDHYNKKQDFYNREADRRTQYNAMVSGIKNQEADVNMKNRAAAESTRLSGYQDLSNWLQAGRQEMYQRKRDEEKMDLIKAHSKLGMDDATAKELGWRKHGGLIFKDGGPLVRPSLMSTLMPTNVSKQPTERRRYAKNGGQIPKHFLGNLIGGIMGKGGSGGGGIGGLFGGSSGNKAANIIGAAGNMAGGIKGMINSGNNAQKQQPQQQLQQPQQQISPGNVPNLQRMANNANSGLQSRRYGGPIPTLRGSDSKANKIAELERDELAMNTMGQVFRVGGKTHEKGGEKFGPDVLPPGSIVISDHLKFPGTKKTYADVTQQAIQRGVNPQQIVPQMFEMQERNKPNKTRNNYGRNGLRIKHYDGTEGPNKVSIPTPSQISEITPEARRDNTRTRLSPPQGLVNEGDRYTEAPSFFSDTINGLANMNPIERGNLALESIISPYGAFKDVTKGNYGMAAISLIPGIGLIRAAKAAGRAAKVSRLAKETRAALASGKSVTRAGKIADAAEIARNVDKATPEELLRVKKYHSATGGDEINTIRRVGKKADDIPASLAKNERVAARQLKEDVTNATKKSKNAAGVESNRYTAKVGETDAKLKDFEESYRKRSGLKLEDEIDISKMDITDNSEYTRLFNAAERAKQEEAAIGELSAISEKLKKRKIHNSRTYQIPKTAKNAAIIGGAGLGAILGYQALGQI